MAALGKFDGGFLAAINGDDVPEFRFFTGEVLLALQYGVALFALLCHEGSQVFGYQAGDAFALADFAVKLLDCFAIGKTQQLVPYRLVFAVLWRELLHALGAV